VKVTEWLTAEGLGDDTANVVVVVVLTTCEKVPFDPLKFESEGLNAALMMCVPCEESGTVQGGTTPPVNAELPVAGNVQSVVAPSE
jgi:hypothetical protein